MAWELIDRTRVGLNIGEYTARKATNFHLPHLRDKNYNWYLDRKLNIAKMQIEKNGLRVVHKQITTPIAISKALDLTKADAIVLLLEDALYICKYKDGQEHLQKFLKAEKK